MKKSKLGYKRHSPDVNNPYNVIPSGRITMKDVDFPVYGIDNFGNEQMMYPGGEYQFPGNEVLEIPEFGSGGLKQWFDEKWVDVKTGKECGRSGKDKDGRPYPACRPSRRVNSTTPKTTSEMSSSEKARFKREKTSGKRIDYNHKRAQQGGQMSAFAGYDSWYNSPMVAGRYTFNPKDPAEYYVEGYGTKQGPGIAVGMDYTNPKYRTQGMIRAGLDSEIGANLRAQGGYRFNPIDNRREQLTWGPYGSVRFQTEDYYEQRPGVLAYNNLQSDLTYGVNARYNKALANRGRFSIEGDLGMAMGTRPERNLGEGFDPIFYGAVKATYSPPMYKNTRNKNTGNRKPRPTTYSSGYQMGGSMTPQGLSPAFFTGIKNAAVDAFKSFMASPDASVPEQFGNVSAPVDWRKLSRPEQIKYGIDQVTALEAEANRKPLENLLEATAYMENRYGEDPRAYGRKYTNSFMSIDPIALQDMFTGRGAEGRYNSAQQRQFENFKRLNLPTDRKEFNTLLTQDNPVAAMAAARYRYALVPEALPDMNNPEAMFNYWLKYYNGNGVLKHQSRAQAFKDFQRAYQRALSND